MSADRLLASERCILHCMDCGHRTSLVVATLMLLPLMTAAAVKLNSRAAAVALLHRVGLEKLGWFHLLPMQVPACCPRERGEETWIYCVGCLASLFASYCNSKEKMVRGQKGGRLVLSDDGVGVSLQCLAAVAK